MHELTQTTSEVMFLFLFAAGTVSEAEDPLIRGPGWPP